MKIFMTLAVFLSMFFIISCGGEDDSGIDKVDFYAQSKTQICERGFECGDNYVTSAYDSSETCLTELEASSCPMSYDGVKAQECLDCTTALTCDKFFDGIMGVLTNCPVCNEVCGGK